MSELLVGVAFFVFWLLMDVFNVATDKAALVTAIIFIIVGLFFGRPWERDRRV